MKNKEDGVAIILVLGMLAILMLSGAAFSLSMRIEREGAYNMRHGLQAHHMARGAVAQAIRDLNDDLDGPSVSDFKIYPDWQGGILVSPKAPDPRSTRCRVLTRRAAEYVPASLLAAAKKAEPYWHPIYDQKHEMRGRTAYMVINTSGLLDASEAGDSNSTVRAVGQSPREIQVGGLMASGELVNIDEYVWDRLCLIRYETFAELNRLCNGLETDNIRNFFVHSRAPLRERLGAGKMPEEQVYIGGEQATWDGLTRIKDAFVASGLTEQGALYAVGNLIDYVDTDSEPTNLQYPCTESVPMLNEVQLDWEVTFEGSNVTVTVKAWPEWYYPFVKGTDKRFDMRCSLGCRANAGNGSAAWVPGWAWANYTDLKQGEMAPGDVMIVPDRIVTRRTATNVADDQVTIDIDANFTARIMLSGTGTIVDEVPSPYGDGTNWATRFQFRPIRCTIARGQSVTGVPWSVQCIDPRFNWDPSDTDDPHDEPQWALYRSPDNLGDTNQAATGWLRHSSFPSDGDPAMYVANTNLCSVGELGYLCCGRWQTIRLYDHGSPVDGVDYHKVLDHFTLHPATNRSFARGLLNVNTAHTNALAAVFYRCPLEEYDPAIWQNPPAGLRISDWDAAVNIARRIITTTKGTPFDGLSGLGRAVIDWPSFVPGGASEIVKEGPIRNTVNLLTVRDQSFTILVAADSYSYGVGGDLGGLGHTLSSTMAVAEIWRDAFRAETGTGSHRCLLRFLEILEE